jgi:hypothetical protein
MIARIWQAITGRPWTTVRSAAAEFGPPPAARYAAQLAAYSDTELIRHGEAILARLRRQDTTAIGPAGQAAASTPVAAPGR